MLPVVWTTRLSTPPRHGYNAHDTSDCRRLPNRTHITDVLIRRTRRVDTSDLVRGRGAHHTPHRNKPLELPPVFFDLFINHGGIVDLGHVMVEEREDVIILLWV